MAEAFVIMQIGNSDLDRICDEVIFAALRDSGLEPRRVDKHNRGDLLKSEIVRFIEESEIIVADLTNERPNCYLEIGYAMGIGKKSNLILTARADHFASHPQHSRTGPRIHFDLQGYDILRWDPADLETFRKELGRRIRYRRAILSSPASTENLPDLLGSSPDSGWKSRNRESAIEGLSRIGLISYWETIASIHPPGNWNQVELRQAVNASMIDTFGWPIGINFDRDGERIQPTAGGIRAQVSITPETSNSNARMYDYWTIQRTGDFYYLRGFYEDSLGRSKEIFFDTRTIQVTEMLLFLARLFGQQLEVPTETKISVTMTHSGLTGRHLSAIRSRAYDAEPNTEAEAVSNLTTTVGDLEFRLVENVKALLDPVFILFNFREFSKRSYELEVDRFVSGDL